MIRYLEWDSLASRRKQACLCTRYKISNDIIHVNKSNYLTPATETRTRGSHGFKYFIENISNDIFKYSYFPRIVREWNSFPSDIVSSIVSVC